MLEINKTVFTMLAAAMVARPRSMDYMDKETITQT